MKEYFAYIDESGDVNFAKDASEYFLLAAVIIESEKVENIRELSIQVKKRYGLQELKSKRMANSQRRDDILRELLALDIKLATVFINKRELKGEWFKHKTGFYKYVQRLLNHDLYKVLGNVDVSIDKYGSEDYQVSLKKYLENSIQGELFDPYIMIGTAKENDLIQIADFIAGSILRSLKEHNGEIASPIKDWLLEKWIIRINLPDSGYVLRPIPDSLSSQTFSICIDEVKKHLDQISKNKRDPKYLTLEYLYYSAIDGRDEWVYTIELVNWLKTYGYDLSEDQFRNTIMSELRDEGLIIIGSRKGLKIPTTLEDMIQYVHFTTGLTLPVLKRLKRSIVYLEARTDLPPLRNYLSQEMRRIMNEVDA